MERERQRDGRRGGMRADFEFLSGTKVFPGRARGLIFGLETGQMDVRHLPKRANDICQKGRTYTTIYIHYIQGHEAPCM